MCIMTMFCTCKCNNFTPDEEQGLVTNKESKSAGFWSNPLNKLSVGSGAATAAGATFTFVAHEYLSRDWAIGGGVICFLSLCTFIASTCPTQRRAIEKMDVSISASVSSTNISTLQV